MTTSALAAPGRPLDLPFAVTPRRTGSAAAVLTSLVLAHRALRSGARLVADAATDVANGAPCSAERHDAIVWFTEHVLHEVAEHHRKDDDVLWPVLAASVGAEVDLAALSDEHGVLHAVLNRATDALRIFHTHGDLGAGRLAAALTELADDLDEHVAAEEARVFPVIRQYVSRRDYARVEARYARHYPYTHLLFVVSWLLDVAEADEVDAVRASFVVRLRLRRRQERWERRRDLVRGTHTE